MWSSWLYDGPCEFLSSLFLFLIEWKAWHHHEERLFLCLFAPITDTGGWIDRSIDGSIAWKNMNIEGSSSRETASPPGNAIDVTKSFVALNTLSVSTNAVDDGSIPLTSDDHGGGGGDGGDGDPFPDCGLVYTDHHNNESNNCILVINSEPPDSLRMNETITRNNNFMITLERFIRTMFSPEPKVLNNHHETTSAEEGMIDESFVVDRDDDDQSKFDRFLDYPLITIDGGCGHSVEDNRRDVVFVEGATKVILCIFFLQITYLIHGYEQEGIVLAQYEPSARVPSGRFPMVSLCVHFCDRSMTVLVAAAIVTYRHGVKRGLLFQNHHHHHHHYHGVSSSSSSSSSSYSTTLRASALVALGHTISSWYEHMSFRYVGCPIRIIFRSMTIVPVMVLGERMRGTSRYSSGEVAEGIVIAIGAFMVGSVQLSTTTTTTTTTHNPDGRSASVEMILYLAASVVADASSRHRRGAIHDPCGRRGVDIFQVMLAANVLAVAFSIGIIIIIAFFSFSFSSFSFSTTTTDDIGTVVDFLLANPGAARGLGRTAVASALGQVAVYHTIGEYGPVMYAIIVTVRPVLCAVASAFIYPP